MRYPLPALSATQTITTPPSPAIDFSEDYNAISKVNADKEKQIDVMDEEANEPESPEVRKRLAKLKELNDSYNISDDDFEITTSPPKTKRLPKTKKAKVTRQKPT